MTESHAEHYEYMLKKQQRTLSLWDSIMHRSVSWSDFPNSEKPVTVESDTDFSQQTKSTEDKSTTDKNVKFKKIIEDPNKPVKKIGKWFPNRRIQDG